MRIGCLIVEGHLDETKTESSNKKLPLDPQIVTALLGVAVANPICSRCGFRVRQPGDEQGATAQ
jgi:hypothetical protein